MALPSVLTHGRAVRRRTMFVEDLLEFDPAGQHPVLRADVRDFAALT